MIPFNVNDDVFVKITDYGKSCMAKDDLEFSRKYGDILPARKIVEDADGWSRWQLWVLMQIFGKHVSMGQNNPFEMNIMIDYKPKEEK